MTPSAPTILVCPDALKETATAREAASAIAQGVHRVLPGAVVRRLPLADGGEGTLDVVAEAITDLRIRRMNVSGPRPDRDPVAARFAVDAEGRRAVVELAEVAGMARLPVEDRDPLATGTAGVGRLLDHAREALATVSDGSPSELLLALGGSVTVDGGIGAVRALGGLVEGPQGEPDRRLVGDDLAAVTAVSRPEAVARRWAGIRVRLLADVRNPLAGPRGAARVFGPQKGATPEVVTSLDRDLERWGGLLRTGFGVDPEASGAGAAGGIGLALSAIIGGRLESGFEAVAGLLDLRSAIEGSTLVITSEGRLDEQSLGGKVIGGVLDLAEASGVPVMAVPGGIDPALSPQTLARFEGIRSLEAQVGPAEARRDPATALREATAHLLGGRRS